MAGDNSLKSVLVAVVANTLVTIAKYIGFAFTGSPALLAEGIHSTADVANQVLLWVGIKVSARDASPEHPYGWGPARYLWNLKSAMGIFFLGCGVTLWHGGASLLHYLQGQPGHGGDTGWWGVGVLLFALVLEGFSLIVAINGINRDRGDMPFRDFLTQGDDPTGVGVLLEDGAAVLGVIFALIGVGLSQALHNPLPDIISTLAIGLLLGWLAHFLAITNGRLLIGRSVPPGTEEKIRAALEADEIVEKVEDLKTMILGQGKIRVKAEVDFYETLVAKRMRATLDENAQQLRDGGDPMKILVEVVGRSVRTAGWEIKRLEGTVREVAPEAIHIDLELQ